MADPYGEGFNPPAQRKPPSNTKNLGPPQLSKQATASAPAGKVGAGAPARNADEALTQAAWLLINGKWPVGIDVPQEVRDRADALEHFLATMSQDQNSTSGKVASGVQPKQADSLALELQKMMAALTGGGGGGGGGYGGAPSMPEADTVDTPEEIDAYVRATYGYLAGYLQDPEIGPILRQAATEGWDENRLMGAVSGTSWYQNTTKNARQFDALKNMDPATWQQQVNNQLELIRRQAKMLGLTISGRIELGEFGSYDRDYYMAVQSLREGWDPQKLATAIFNEGAFRPDQAQQTGQIKTTASKIKSLASEYMLTVSDATANQYAQQIILGQLDEGAVATIFADQAKGRFPSLADQIDKGIRPAQFFDSYQQQIAAMLEIDPDQVDLMSPKWAKIIDNQRSDGTRSPMTLSETMDYVRSTPEWDRTDNAMKDAAYAAELLGKTFGKVG